MTPTAPAPEAIPAVQALAEEAARAMRAGRVAEARQLLEQAVQRDRSSAPLWLHLAATRRASGDFAGAEAAAEEALRIEPRFFPALLMKATLIERAGREREAAKVYGLALMQAPPDARLDDTTREVLARGRALNLRYLEGLRTHLDRTVFGVAESMQGGRDAAAAERLKQFFDITLGIRQRVQQNPSHYFYPGLPPVEFWPRERFPWLGALEAATPRIQAELAAVMGGRGFTPYVEYGAGIPLDQWAALNHSLDWSAFHFFHYGQRYADNCARCPETLDALAALPQPVVSERMPAAMFSVLKPRTRIPPHTGVANVRLVVHLPLVVPPGCGFRVGNVTREWRVGEAFVFDDTIEHEAWNDSDETRVVLIADVWHPDLSVQEREWISRTLIAMDEFGGQTTPLPL